MASNSKRERIIVATKAELESIDAIAHVARVLPTMEELIKFPSTQFPLIAMVAGLTKPTPHKSGRGTGLKDVFISNLKIDLFCYFVDKVNPDTTLSSLLDDIWKKLYLDQRKGGLVISTELDPTMEIDFWDPYYAFKVSIIYSYNHTIGGI